MSLRGSVAIVAAAEAGVGMAPPGATPLSLAALAATRALAQVNLRPRDVDGLFATSAYHNQAGLATGEYLGIRPRYSDSSNHGGSTPVSHVLHAMAALNAGLCDVALISYGSTQASDGGKLVSGVDQLPSEASFGARYPVSMYALIASRYLHTYSRSREELAQVAVVAREWSRHHPGATERSPLSTQDVLSSRMISSPLTVRDCCLVTDGAGAAVLTRAERARDLVADPVYVLGAGEAHDHRYLTQMPDLATTAAVDSGARAYQMAGVRAADVDVAQIYDAFTINVPVYLEDLGLAPRGEGLAFIADGHTAPGGSLPTNTAGGGLAYAHPGMFGIFLLTEAFAQLRGTSPGLSVPGAEVALVHGNGGVMGGQATAILARSSAL